MAKIQNTDYSSCWRGCVVKGTLLHCWWECKMLQPLWKSLWRFIRKLRNKLHPDPAILYLLGMYSRDAQSNHEDMCSPMPKAALFVITRTYKQPKCPLKKQCIKKMWYIYAMEYYTAEQNNDILKFSGKWMDIENIILSEEIHTQKYKYNMQSLISGLLT